jgi:pyrroline-5-carboxylate reductase
MKHEGEAGRKGMAEVQSIARRVLVHRLLVLGVGNMGGALMKGALRGEGLSQSSVTFVDPHREKVQPFLDGSLKKAKEHHYATSLRECSDSFDIVLLAVKPQLSSKLLPVLSPLLEENALIISVMAGRSCDTIRRELGREMAIVRAMPNLPATQGLGMTVLYRDIGVTDEQFRFAHLLFSQSGEVLQVSNEDMVQAATAISGSGPGFLYHLLQPAYEETLSLGFSEEEAEMLVLQTLRGAIELYAASPYSFPELEAKVTSPQGTTEAGAKALRSCDAQGAIRKCIQEAFKRAQELRE